MSFSLTKKKKILFSTTSFSTIDNGPALFANILHKKLADSDDYDLRFVSEDINVAKHNDKRIYVLDLRKKIYNKFFYQFFRIFFYDKKAQLIRNDFHFDIIIYNNAFTGILTAVKKKIPVIVMINDYNRSSFLENKRAINKDYFKNIILFQLEKIAAKKAGKVIVNSIFMKTLISNMYNIPLDKINVLYKGIEIEKYNFRLRLDFDKCIKILFVKAGFENGGLYILLESIRLMTEYDFELTIIGPRLIEIEKIKLVIDELGLTNCKFIEPTAPESVRLFMDRADIFCVPSYKEALGVANMEALACGLPVISTNVGGIPEVLDYGNCGWLVEPGNASALANAFRECIENKSLRVKKSNLGKEFVQRYNSNFLVDNFMEILNGN